MENVNSNKYRNDEFYGSRNENIASSISYLSVFCTGTITYCNVDYRLTNLYQFMLVKHYLTIYLLGFVLH